MAKAQKTVYGIPNTKLPNNRRAPYKIIAHKFDFDTTVQFLQSNPIEGSWVVQRFLERVREGLENGTNWTDWGDEHRVLNAIWEYTDEFKEMNGKFFEEYDRREDMQELYRNHVRGRYWLYGLNSKTATGADAEALGWFDRPEWYGMYEQISASWEAKEDIAKRVEVEYQEGDIVKLRASAVGNRRADPLYHRWQPFPGKETDRIGTVMNVTENVSYSRGGPGIGSKIVEVLWFGEEDSRNVPVKHLKWLERPTLKNGLKVREGKE